MALNGKIGVVSFIIMFFMVPLCAHADCPISDFDKVVTFCTEDNELGITYPANMSNEIIHFFSDCDEEGHYVNNIGCMCDVISPVWYAMQIEHGGSLLIELSHSEMGDIDFACYGPFEGSSKRDMLNKVCSDPGSNFWTNWSYERYCEDFYNDYQWDVVYSEDCRFIPENKPIYDSLLLYSSKIVETNYDYLQCYKDFVDGFYSEEEFIRCSDGFSLRWDSLADLIYEFQLVDPRYYDTTSNCFRPDVDPFPDGKMVDCCISPNAKEICRIDNAKHGEWYLLILSNFAQKDGDILFKKIGGDATTNCDVIVDASVNDQVCEGDDIRFTVNNAPPGATFVWTGPNGFLSTLPSPIISNASKENGGTYSVQMEVDGKKSPVINLDVMVNPSYEVDTSVRIQYGDTLDLEGRRLWASGVYDFRLTSVTGCDSLVHLTLLVDTFNVNIITEYNGPLCEGETLVLSARQIPERVKVEWTGPDGFHSADSFVTIPNVSARNSGTYYLKAFYVDLKMDVPPVTVDVNASDTVELFSRLSDSVLVFNDIVIREVGDYSAQLINAHGCDSIVLLHVELSWDSVLIVPEPYFSPNGDGVKDRWFIDRVENYPTSVKIYDRFGKIIRVYDVYTNEEGWDGKDANGNDMPSTDYWYVISNRTIDKLFVGHVALVR